MKYESYLEMPREPKSKDKRFGKIILKNFNKDLSIMKEFLCSIERHLLSRKVLKK